MPDLLWPLLWAAAGLPLLTLNRKYSLLKKSAEDYAYYVESKEFAIGKLFILKVSLFVMTGVTFTFLALPLDRMIVALTMGASFGYVLESTVLVGRSHPTPKYAQTRFACAACQKIRHDDCTNVRMLDGFESAFRSKDGLVRPVCCCGFQMSVLREVSV